MAQVKGTITQKSVTGTITESGYSVVGTTPIFVSAAVANDTPTKVVLTYDQTLDTGSVPATTDYTLAGKTISNVAIVGATVEVTVSSQYFYGDVIAISYTKGTNPLRGDIGKIDVANLVNQSVTNNVTVIALTRNTDEVVCSGYLNIETSANLQLTATPGALTLFMQRNNLGVIRQTGLVTKVQFHVTITGAALSSFYIEFFRKDGATYDRIGYEDIVSQVTATGTILATLTTPVSVQLGDYVVIGGNRGSGTGSQLAAKTGYTSGSNRYKDFSGFVTSPDQNYAWDSGPAGTWIVPVKCYMQAPMIAIIGDSIASGHGSGAGGSFIENTLYPATTKLLGYCLYNLNSKNICQDMGIGSQTTTQIEARFDADVVALKPKIAVIEGGVNDIFTGVTKATFIAKMTSMLNKCSANGIIPVVCKVLPWTNGTNTQLQTRDDWMTTLEALVATYSGSVWVDFDTDMGKFRVGGDAGNLWDLQTDPDYDDDGVHPTLLGYQKMAEVINNKIVEKYYLQ